MLQVDFIEVDICYRMGPFRMLYSMTLSEIFKVKFVQVAILTNKRWKHYYCHRIGSHVYAI